jgi:hypothetical protein
MINVPAIFGGMIMGGVWQRAQFALKTRSPGSMGAA